MGLRVIGAGLPRTGTASLKAALEQLLDGPCYHMFEFFPRVEEDGPRWWAALDGDVEALAAVTSGWSAAVDWPASVMWRELAELYPDAPVVLSHRGDAATWWRSVDATVWDTMRTRTSGPIEAWNAKLRTTAGFGEDWDDRAAACARYDAHMNDVIDTISPDRLVLWQATEGWGPLCRALDLPEPDGPFLHENTTADFNARREAHAAETDTQGEQAG